MLLRPSICKLCWLHRLSATSYIHNAQTLHISHATQSSSDQSPNLSYLKDLITDLKKIKELNPSKLKPPPDENLNNENIDGSYFNNIEHKLRPQTVSSKHQEASMFGMQTQLAEISSKKNNVMSESLVPQPNVKLSIQIDESKPIVLKRVTHDVGNLAPLVTSHVVLRELVKLGVNLSQLEKVPGVANNLLRLDISLDVIPRLKFLKELGVPEEKFSNVINKFPLLFKNNIDDMRAVFQYFQSKNFASESLTEIFLKQPNILGMEVTAIDKQLGCIQQLFYLKGDEVRQIITDTPRLIQLRLSTLQNFHTALLKQMNFSLKEVKSMIIAYPRLLLQSQSNLMKNFAFLNRSLELDLDYISLYPRALAGKPQVLKERIKFLKFLNKLQLDRNKEHFTSLDAIITLRAEALASQVANVGYSEYLRFLKTL